MLCQSRIPSPSVQEEQVSVKKFLMIPGFPSPLGQRIPPLLPHGKLSTKSTFTVVRMRGLRCVLEACFVLDFHLHYKFHSHKVTFDNRRSREVKVVERNDL